MTNLKLFNLLQDSSLFQSKPYHSQSNYLESYSLFHYLHFEALIR